MPGRNVPFPTGVNVSGRYPEMAGFQVSINGRIWVSTEDGEDDRRRAAPGGGARLEFRRDVPTTGHVPGGRAVEAAMSIDSTFARRATSAAVVLLAAGLAAAPAAAQTARRVALVLGNSDYRHISRLPNPGNAAADMSAALRRLDFEVTTELDADRTEVSGFTGMRRFGCDPRRQGSAAVDSRPAQGAALQARGWAT